MTTRPPRSARRPWFMRLGIAIARHPWYPVVGWLVLLGVSLPVAMHASSATTANATALSSNYPSVVASDELARLFPTHSASASSLLVFYGTNVTTGAARNAIEATETAIAMNASLSDFAGVSSFFSSYQRYLESETLLALTAWQVANSSSPTLLQGVNTTASLLWGPPAAFVTNWQALVAANPSNPPPSENYPAYNMTFAGFAGNPAAQANLTSFYAGLPGNPIGFNGSANCAAAPGAVVLCSNQVVRSVVAAKFGVANVSSPPLPPLVTAVAAGLAIGNYSAPSAQLRAAAITLGFTSGLPDAWLSTVEGRFPSWTASPAQVVAWSAAWVSNSSFGTYPLPVPLAIIQGYLNPAGNVTFLLLSFTAADSSATVSQDLAVVQSIVTATLLAANAPGSLRWLPTGDAALTQNSNTLLASDLGITVPATVGILILITILYFRAPGSPLLTLAPIGVALLLGLAGLTLVGTYVEKVHTSALTLLTVFVLGVGTDYSVFLLARYREELARGRSPRAAVVLSVTWAGESIATSGIAIIFATIALAFSGASLLSEWGLVLSIALSIAVLAALTLVPALLFLVGPRIFWPYTGDRFRRQRDAQEQRQSVRPSYFLRVGRFSTRHAGAILVIAVAISAPIVYVAVNVPLAYDYFGQLPANQPAARGLAVVADNFGPGFPFPLQVLVTFASPLIAGSTPNATEFAQVVSLTGLLGAAPGVARVDSPTAVTGAPLTSWLGFASLPPAQQFTLRGLLSSYVGTDGRTVLFTVQMAESGLSNSAVASLNWIQSQLVGYQQSHTDVTGLAYGGATSITRDVQQQLAQGTQRLEIAVVIGLMAVLLLVLVSAILPPLAVATIGLSIAWAWGTTYWVLNRMLGLPLFSYVPVILFIVLMGLGMDYNIFLLTRVREERLAGQDARDSVVSAISRTGGIITAAAVILGGAFFVLLAAQTTFLRAIGLAVGLSVILDAMVVRTYLVPAILGLLGDRVWWAPRFLTRLRRSPIQGGDGGP